MTNNVLKFVDDTLEFRKVKNDGDKQQFQNDLNKLVKMYKTGICYYILGNVNAYTQDTGTWNYTMGDAVLGTTIKENNL